jgi:hypothetical protein
MTKEMCRKCTMLFVQNCNIFGFFYPVVSGGGIIFFNQHSKRCNTILNGYRTVFKKFYVSNFYRLPGSLYFGLSFGSYPINSINHYQ